MGTFSGIEDRVTIITGAGQGIGKEIALLFSSHGAKTVIADINEKKVREVAQEISEKKGAVLPICLDVSSQKAVSDLISETVLKWGQVDILVNNAGINKSTFSYEEVREDEWDRIFAVNVKGVYFCIAGVIPIMKKRKWGRIINIGSGAGKTGATSGFAGIHYCASKAAVMCLTKSFARYLGPHGITVNAVAPGLTETDMTKEWSEVGKRTAMITPLGRLGLPSDMANAVLFLASEASSFITGEILDVDGGLLMD
jgi:3-oxoacyl-[acyl-carrier protein] reductase